jgi:GH25 family lysozyme M1 (1,4-beta-N-acetylmuramidase)
MAKWEAIVCIALFGVESRTAEGNPPRPVAAQPPASEVTANSSMDLTPAVLDLSDFNNITISKNLMTRYGIEVILHRATMGDYKGKSEDRDESFLKRSHQIVDAGFRLGAYHWATPTGTGRIQADHFLDVVQGACKDLRKKQVLLAFDWEPHDGNRDFYMEASEVHSFLQRVKERTGKNALVYGSESFLRERQTDILNTLGLMELLKGHPLWIARYGKEPGPKIMDSPWADWSLWQYTDHKNDTPTPLLPGGRIDGQRLDRSVFHGSRDGLKRFVDSYSWNCVYQ